MSELRKSLNNVYYGGLATSAMDTLATGPILISYALLFGAENITIGLLGSVNFIGNLFHLYSAYLIDRGHNPKPISILFTSLSRPFYLLAGLLAFWAGAPWALCTLIVFLTLAYTTGAIAGGAWLPWMKELVPTKLIGRFFAQRFRGMMITKMLFYILSATLLWFFEKHLPNNQQIFAYSILLLLAFIIGAYGVFTLKQVQECKIPTQPTTSFINKIFHTLRNKSFRKLIIFLGSLNFAVNFVTPFFTVFMLQHLGISTAYVILLTFISQFSHIASIKTWGRTADKTNCTVIMHRAIPIFTIAILAFATCNFIPSLFGRLVMLVLIHIILGLGQSAITLGTNNISFLYTPSQDTSIYLSVNSVFKSFVSAIASILAGVSLTFFSHLGNTVSTSNGTEIGWCIFFATGAICCLTSIKLLAGVKKC